MMQKKNCRFSRTLAFVTAIFMFAGAFPASATSTDKFPEYVIAKHRFPGRFEGTRIWEDQDGTIYLKVRSSQGLVWERFKKGEYTETSLSKSDPVAKEPPAKKVKTRQGTRKFKKGKYAETSLSKSESPAKETPAKKVDSIKRLCWFDPAADALWEELIQSSERLSLAPRMKGVDAAQAERQLEEFGTRAMPNAYAQYREARAKVQEVKRARLENFPQGPASDPTDGTMFAKANKNLATAVARVFRRRDELCFFLLFHQMGLFSDEMLTKYDSRPILLRLAAESNDWPDDTPAADTALAAEDGSFAAQHLPGTHAGYQRLSGLFEAGAKQYADLRRTALALDAARAHLELEMLQDRLESIQEVLLQYKKDFAVKRLEFGLGEATAESLAALDQSNTAEIQEFEGKMGVKAYVAQRAKRLVVTLPGGAAMEMVWCPPGTFMMGSPEGEKGREKDETQHQVTLTKGFWMAETEVTQAQWMSVMGDNPSRFKGDDLPVENVSWLDCQVFCQKTGLRLPTEAEWEYACRAGSMRMLSAVPWFKGNSGKRTHPVGEMKPNAWGLHDMHGNVWEWCEDCYGDYPRGAVTDPKGVLSGSDRKVLRVFRGGDYHSDAIDCRSANRGRYEQSWSAWRDEEPADGFRPVFVPVQ